MKIYLAATCSRKPEMTVNHEIPYILESYFYCKPWLLDYIRTNSCKGFLLDSGAFTLLEQTQTGTLDFKQLAKEYASFVKRHNIKHYFELDIDGIVGLKGVEKLRDYIENIVGWKSIPVWHKGRGKEYFIEMCKNYSYVSIGGIVARKEIKTKEFPYLHWFIRTAHHYGCKIHGLGFTPLARLEYFDFDSVDSKSWLSGSIGATVYKFDGKRLKTIPNPQGKRRKHYLLLDNHNLKEWLKYVNYMETRGSEKCVYSKENPGN